MSTLFDRMGQVVKSEWNHHFGDEDGRDVVVDAVDVDADATGTRRSREGAVAVKPQQRRRGITEKAQAYRILELPPGATLDKVRAAYFKLATHYHPRTLSKVSDQAYAAQTLLMTLTDALEILETELLPLTTSTRPSLHRD